MSVFDTLKHVARTGTEFWVAREIMEHLGYERWEGFDRALKRAKSACEAAGGKVSDHFRDTTKMVDIGSGAQVARADCYLSRFGCYLTAMNGDPKKPEIAAAQTYFAVQTRQQELSVALSEVEGRVILRDRVKESVKELGKAAKEIGVTDYAALHHGGYKGLYQLSLREIKSIKGIPENEDLLDCIGRAELAANEFKNTQAEMRLRRQKPKTNEEAAAIHRDVGKAVRETMIKEGGTAPEDLPREPSLKAIRMRPTPKPLEKRSSQH